MSCFRACERERKSCEYFLFEPRGASLNRVDWFESCSSFMKHTHIIPDSLCVNKTTSVVELEGRETRRKRHNELKKTKNKTGNQSSDNATVPYRKAVFIETPSPPH